jgi:hypothetical protein
MMYAGHHAGIQYGDYAADYRRLAEAQVAIARDYDFDFVSATTPAATSAANLVSSKTAGSGRSTMKKRPRAS